MEETETRGDANQNASPDRGQEVQKSRESKKARVKGRKAIRGQYADGKGRVVRDWQRAVKWLTSRAMRLGMKLLCHLKRVGFFGCSSWISAHVQNQRKVAAPAPRPLACFCPLKNFLSQSNWRRAFAKLSFSALKSGFDFGPAGNRNRSAIS